MSLIPRGSLGRVIAFDHLLLNGSAELLHRIIVLLPGDRLSSLIDSVGNISERDAYQLCAKNYFQLKPAHFPSGN